ncbi:mannose-P-dolichol utilization defect 1 protein homolog [Centruroides sculpturatus]|uniref:mannose-P-dolichol utilization defect 1 protein homolog n=1 Tax=Centruroides sculpturatus TaxID=218467 RepID=UPI000C6D9CBB|nr:mannose-P-dolichol utilization defect 1 protein homolog [Centruroides sculpturatus]
MAEAFKKLLLLFLTESCYIEFFVKFNFFNVKVPQIVKIIKGNSAAGINFFGTLLELLAITSGAAYCFINEFPFSAWGESFFLLIETAFIAYLILFYNGYRNASHMFVALYSFILYLLFGGATSKDLLWNMQAFNVPIIVVGKMVQAVQNYKNGHTGQLSAGTVFLLFVGSCARIFTSVQETGDDLIIVTYVVASLANFVIAVQMIYYWKATNRLVDQAKTQ